MKARILSRRTAPGLEAELGKLIGEAITVRHVGYSIDPKGMHFALVLYTEGAERADNAANAASRFIADALDAGTPAATKEV